MTNRYNLSSESYKELQGYKALLKKMHKNILKDVLEGLRTLSMIERNADRIARNLKKRERQGRDSKGRFARK